MKIIQVFNNNCVLSYDEKDNEVIVTGTGIGFKKKPGMDIDGSNVVNLKIYKLDIKMDDSFEYFRSLSAEYYEIVDEVISAYVTPSMEISANKIFLLIDHIYTMVKRLKSGNILKNNLLNEMKIFYSREFQMGMYTVGLVNKRFLVQADENEAAFIALHFVNLEWANMSEAYKSVDMVNDIINIVRYNLRINLREESYLYTRFVTHLKYLSMRLIRNQECENTYDDQFRDFVFSNYKDSLNCVNIIRGHLIKSYGFQLDANETIYLILHLESLKKV